LKSKNQKISLLQDELKYVTLESKEEQKKLVLYFKVILEEKDSLFAKK